RGRSTGHTGIGGPPPPAHRIALSRACHFIPKDQSVAPKGTRDRPLLAAKRSLTCNSRTPEFESYRDCKGAGACNGVGGDRLDLSAARSEAECDGQASTACCPVRNASRM